MWGDMRLKSTGGGGKGGKGDVLMEKRGEKYAVKKG